MNKYLLLRDNKQTGPYSVPEIIAMGIKPYDLVWLEGKSAAWRYPSEIDELKAHSPAVEEQPFDRFYKKPETRKAESPSIVPSSTLAEFTTSTEHKKYEPPVHQESPSLTEKAPRKVYINFPGNAAPVSNRTVMPATQANTAVRESSPASIKAPTSNIPAQAAAPAAVPPRENSLASVKEVSAFSENSKINIESLNDEARQTYAPRHTSASSNANLKNNKLLYGAIAACLLLIVFSTVMLINYRQQQQSLKELNTIVQQLENKPDNETIILPAKQEEPAPVAEEVTAAANDFNEPLAETPATPPSQTGRAKSVRTDNSNRENEAAVVFTPKQEVEDKSSVSNPESTPAVSTENLFDLVNVKQNDFKIGLLGGISNLSFEVTNNSTVELHRVAVEVRFLGPEKKVVKKQMIYFENISPGAQNTINVPKSNRGVAVEYTVTDIKS